MSEIDLDDPSFEEDLALAKTADRGADGAKLRIIVRCEGIITHAIRKLRIHADAESDARQSAAVAILGLISVYDPARGVPFPAFALRFVEGAVRDGVFGGLPRTRTSDDPEAPRQPRLVTLSSVRDVAPDDGPDADEFLADIGARLVPSGQRVDDGLDPAEGLPPELALAVRRVVAELPVEKRRLLLDVYVSGRSQVAAARERGISPSAVNQQLKSIVAFARERLEPLKEAA